MAINLVLITVHTVFP